MADLFLVVAILGGCWVALMRLMAAADWLLAAIDRWRRRRVGGGGDG